MWSSWFRCWRMLRRRAPWVSVCKGVEEQLVAIVEKQQTVVNSLGAARVAGRSLTDDCWWRRVYWVYRESPELKKKHWPPAAINMTRGNVKDEKKEGNQESFFLFFIYEHLEFQFDQKCIF
uniref:Uncharacterized protein n=2 Tax=Cucumis melo TaxID=3656 RepID=A0A9I9DTH0_CUCME